MDKLIDVIVTGVCRDCPNISVIVIRFPPHINQEGKKVPVSFRAFCEHESVCSKVRKEEDID